MYMYMYIQISQNLLKSSPQWVGIVSDWDLARNKRQALPEPMITKIYDTKWRHLS